MDLKARLLRDEGNVSIPSAVPVMKGMQSSATFFHLRIWHFSIIVADLFSSRGPSKSPALHPFMTWLCPSWRRQKIPSVVADIKFWGAKNSIFHPKPVPLPVMYPKQWVRHFPSVAPKILDIQERELKGNSIVLCNFGDASTNHATALSAFNTASWVTSQGGHVPIIFIAKITVQGFQFQLMTNGSSKILQSPRDRLHPNGRTSISLIS